MLAQAIIDDEEEYRRRNGLAVESESESECEGEEC